MLVWVPPGEQTTARPSEGFSTMAQQGEITMLLNRWKDGEPAAFDELMPLVYPHLREVAGAYLRRERDPGVMQATVLVHELYLRLLSQRKTALADRCHFFTFSAKVMRLILIDHARTQKAARRGGGMQRVPLSDDLLWIGVGSTEMIELNTALEELHALDPRKVQLVELRYFLGCTAEETATLVGSSKATVDRDLKFARSWLFRRIQGAPAPGLKPI